MIAQTCRLFPEEIVCGSYSCTPSPAARGQPAVQRWLVPGVQSAELTFLWLSPACTAGRKRAALVVDRAPWKGHKPLIGFILGSMWHSAAPRLINKLFVDWGWEVTALFGRKLYSEPFMGGWFTL